MICSQRGREAKGHPSGVSPAARWEAGGHNAWWGVSGLWEGSPPWPVQLPTSCQKGQRSQGSAQLLMWVSGSEIKKKSHLSNSLSFF